MSGGRILSCAYCGTRITRRVVQGVNIVFNDSTGNRNCSNRIGDLEHTPSKEESIPPS